MGTIDVNGSNVAVILVVDQSAGDVRLLEEAFADGSVANAVYAVSDSPEALAFLRQEGDYEDAPSPDLVLLDLGLPSRDGGGLLAELKTDPELRPTPVIVLTGSDAEEDILRSYDLNANAYIRKPVEPEDFLTIARAIEDFWLALVELPPDGE
ncbi:response regulator [Natronobacterium gregoryi]|uniref:Response regulator n=2 Tax=Natronobacterium gregoryi TaxID=44930 RepID=L0AKM2_NATGS|nr:response regulator [Natronobacterium gregoryi]AFZ74448.1 response regulator with CheY-like receiver domain and winged-helix DNA-binding domain [Natronobacterium gregoryi SP2]ELY72255.1 response regulator receiver protein [Natronobacterium gregoryi SP2]PLK18069.1 response regulator [Natronobacterium gregoryi SP2]SFJ74047.1 Response regulator receiver domain-containing protein [Natronobacterium gregoryi]